MVDIKQNELSHNQLRWFCDPSQFPFECTKELEPLREFIGQDRAIRSIDFGLSMHQPGYNIFVAGMTGTGKTSMVKSYIERLVLEREAKNGPAHPEDWCYVHNFADPDRSNIVMLAQGQGRVFRDSLDDLLRRLKEALGKAFSSEECSNERKRIVEDGQTRGRKIWEQVNARVGADGFVLQSTSVGPALVPVSNGKPMEQAEFLALDVSALPRDVDRA